MEQRIVNCFKCKFFYVTWEKKFPYGCKAIGFKSRKMPCLDVRQISGDHCLYYQEKDI
jgi:hypothetical protein